MLSHSEILSELQTSLRGILMSPDLVLTDSLKFNDIPEWDSLNHVRLISAIEQKFAVRLTSLEIEEQTSVGGFVRLVSSKLDK